MRFFPRQLLTADDMRAEQEYFRQRQRLFNHFVVGWGVVCGLEVKSDPKQPQQLVVCPGYALDPCGGDIHVPQAVKLDLARYLAIPEDPCAPPVPAAAAAAPTIDNITHRRVLWPMQAVQAQTSPDVRASFRTTKSSEDRRCNRTAAEADPSGSAIVRVWSALPG